MGRFNLLFLGSLAAAMLVSPRASADDGRTLVVVDTDDPRLALESRASEADPWQVACVGTCDKSLSTNALYRIAGPDVRPSASFRLEPNGDRAIVHTRPRYSGGFTAGIVLTSVGAGFITGAIAELVVAAATQSTPSCTTPPCAGYGFNPITPLIFIGLTAVGLSTLIPGLVMLGHNKKSRVDQAFVAEHKEPTFFGPQSAWALATPGAPLQATVFSIAF
jgi:hypothetical protein